MFSIPFEVSRSTTIARPPGEVFDVLRDFSKWRAWSPWLCQEPECRVDVEGEPGKVGHKQAWAGDFIGQGDMTIGSVVENERLDCELRFLKPWKTESKVLFRLEPAGDGTEVTWSMRGTLPLVFFWMKKMMDGFVGGDYERGLKMLEEYLETGAVVTKVDVRGPVDAGGFSYVGKRRTCTLKEIGPAMKEDLESLAGMVEGGALPKPEKVMSIYHRFDMAKGVCEYTTGFGYATTPAVSDGALETGTLPDHRALRVDHEGPYEHLGNAWAAAMGCGRAKHKIDKKLPPYEVYANDPHEVEAKDIRTEVYVPIR